MALAGKHPGGYGGAPGAKNVKSAGGGKNGRGTMKFTTSNVPVDRKHIIGGVGQRPPMPNAIQGRVIYSGKSRTGQKEGTAKQY